MGTDVIDVRLPLPQDASNDKLGVVGPCPGLVGRECAEMRARSGGKLSR